MRKLVLLLFLAMLPLQWTAAAVASLCLPDAQATQSVRAHVGAHVDGAGHAHHHAPASTGERASPHQDSAHDQGHGPDGKTLHIDHGGCCHASVSALPTRLALARMPVAPGDFVSRTTVLAVSHSSDSPFRPPRLAFA